MGLYGKKTIFDEQHVGWDESFNRSEELDASIALFQGLKSLIIWRIILRVFAFTFTETNSNS